MAIFCSNFAQLLLLLLLPLCMLQVFSDWPSFLIIRRMRKCTIVHIPRVQRQLDLKYSFEKTLSDELIVSLNALNPVSVTVFQQKRRKNETKEYYIQSGVGVAFVHVSGSERLNGLLMESGTASIAIFQNSSCQRAQPDRFRIQFKTKRCEIYCNHPILNQEI